MVINKKAIKTAILAALALLVGRSFADHSLCAPSDPADLFCHDGALYYPCFLFDRLVYIPFQAAE